ncbi:MAG: twin-arginine translocase TatA/TatE family subunit [Anaerolineae bacterium]
MTLFGIGPGEMLLVLVIALVVVGPRRLPEMARRAGKALRDLRQFVRSIDPRLLADFREVTQEFDSVRLELDGLRAEMAGLQGELADAARDVSRSVNAAVDDANAALAARDPSATVSLASAPNLYPAGNGTAPARLPPAANASPALPLAASALTSVGSWSSALQGRLSAVGADDEIVGERVFLSPSIIGAIAADPTIPATTVAAPRPADAARDAERLPAVSLSARAGD